MQPCCRETETLKQWYVPDRKPTQWHITDIKYSVNPSSSVTPACKQNNVFSIYKKKIKEIKKNNIIFESAGLFHYISALTWLSLTGHQGERGRITQRNKYISISRVLTFSKVLFFIYLQIDVQRTQAEQPLQSNHRAGPTAWPARCMTALTSKQTWCNFSGHKTWKAM